MVTEFNLNRSSRPFAFGMVQMNRSAIAYAIPELNVKNSNSSWIGPLFRLWKLFLLDIDTSPRLV